MKKIGILTFQRTINYGAQLQNFALQEFLSQESSSYNEVCVINYDNKTVNSIEKKFNLKDQRNIKDLIKYLKNGKSKKKRWENFEKFRDEYINLTEEYTKENIHKVDKVIDYYVVGSDQVWNLDITGNDYTYYLDFVSEKEKKDSYAASFGKTSFNENQRKKIMDYLKCFDNINVREKTAMNYIKEFGIASVENVMDPTFLLSKNDWKKRFGLTKNKEDYILVYMIDNIKENFRKIKKFAKERNLKIVYITNDFFNVSGVKNDRDCSPVQFLEYIYNAKYIITGSFHAICFSLIFNKDFYYILNRSNGRNSRLSDLINILKIKEDNDITNKENIEEINLNYSNINKHINSYITLSKQRINKIIKKWSD